MCSIREVFINEEKIMNSILLNTNQMPYHTDLKSIFKAFSGRQNEFNWLIKDIELNNINGKPINRILNKDIIWIPGEDLTEFINEHEIQFIWGVFSGFNKDIIIDLENLEVYPYADGYPHLRDEDIKIQHPLAIVEIVCVDGGFTLLLSKDDNLSKSFRDYFIDAQDLNEYKDQNKRKKSVPSM